MLSPLGKAADEFLSAHAGSFRNEKHKAQWTMTLTRYCEPIRAMPVDAIDTEAVLSVLKPLWARAPETASRLRGRIETVLDAARARGLIDRNQANPARWKNHLDKLLPKRAKLTRGHHAAMPYGDVPAFVAGLREREATAARALEFCILTAARSGEALAARWDEIDLDGKSGVRRSRPFSMTATMFASRGVKSSRLPRISFGRPAVGNISSQLTPDEINEVLARDRETGIAVAPGGAFSLTLERSTR